MRKELFVCSKAGFVPADAFTGVHPRETALNWCKHYDIPPEHFIQEMHCMHPKYLEASLSHSLKNMWLDHLDLLYLHNTAEMQMPEVGKLEYMRRLRDAFQFLEQARRQNNIRYYGLV
jgi:aryl-alcohol dehydrogenase-like predicted oxidoreductase